MDDKTGMPSEQELKEFSALTSHEDRCAYFHDHPALARIYRGAHFPKPGAVEAQTSAPTKE